MRKPVIEYRKKSTNATIMIVLALRDLAGPEGPKIRLKGLRKISIMVAGMLHSVLNEIDYEIFCYKNYNVNSNIRLFVLLIFYKVNTAKGQIFDDDKLRHFLL